jgi:hypothetical protein
LGFETRKYAADDQGLPMTIDLNTSPVFANKARETQYLQLEREQIPVVSLSLAEKETVSLARKAESGESLWDKVILNLVHPPAITLFALLDSGRKVAAPPLPQVQEAYDTVANTAKEAPAEAPQSQATNTAADTSPAIVTTTVAAPVSAAPAAPSHVASPAQTASQPAPTASATTAIIA